MKRLHSIPLLNVGLAFADGSMFFSQTSFAGFRFGGRREGCDYPRWNSSDSLFLDLRRCAAQKLREMPRVPPEKPRDRRSLWGINVELVPGFPFERKMHDGTRLRDLLQRAQRCPQHCDLTCSVLRQPQG